MNRFNVFNAYRDPPFYSGGYKPNMPNSAKLINVEKLQKEIEDFQAEEQEKAPKITLKKLMKEGIILSGFELLILFIIMLVLIYKYIELSCRNSTLTLFYQLNRGLFNGMTK